MDEVLAAYDALSPEDQARVLHLLNKRAENDQRTDALLKDLREDDGA